MSALQLGQQIEYLRLVALEGAQADTIQQRTNLFLRAAFLDREPNDVLLARPHAVNGRAELSTVVASRPGKSSPRQSKRRPSIGLPTSIPLSGAADGGIDRAASPVLASSQPGFERAGVSGIRLARRPKVPPRHEARASTCS